MKRILIVATGIVGVAALPAGSFGATAQQAADADLDSKVRELEERVAKLERLVAAMPYVAPGKTLAERERELAVATQRLQHSERLAAKRYVSSMELEADKLEVEKARLAIELAKSAEGRDRLALQIQLVEAEVALKIALSRLEHSERLAAKGYVARGKVELDKLAAERARLQVESMKAMLSGKVDEQPKDE
jgi:multidrug resistance efflux pump